LILHRILIAAGLIFLPYVMACQTQAPEARTKGREAQGTVAAPDMTVQGLDGEMIRLSDYRGKVVVLNFWATWCPPCRAELPHFVDLYRAYKDKGVVMIGVSMDEAGPDYVRAFSKQVGIPYPIAVAAFPELERVWSPLEGIPTVRGIGTGEPEMDNGSVQMMPTTFIIDRDGYIFRKHVGPRERRHLEPELKVLLGPQAEEPVTGS